MAQTSSIEWTESTWNPVTGCTKESTGCKNCYAERMAARLQAMGQANYTNGFVVTLQPHMLEQPLRWKKPRTIFVSSMSDLFHGDIPFFYVQQVFDVMRRAHWHRFQVLTKRSLLLAAQNLDLEWAPNIWMGVSVETAEYQWRISNLKMTGAAVKFLSLEPLLGPMPDLDLHGIDWVIVGGESGPKARPMRKEWVIDIRDQCCRAGVPFFFKQWGGKNKKRAGRLLEGRTWDEVPGRNDQRRLTPMGLFEQHVVLAILSHSNGAHGAAIVREMEKQTHKAPSFAAVYTTLNRLREKGFVRSRREEARPHRGGRARLVWSVQDRGKRALTAATQGTDGFPIAPGMATSGNA